MKEDKIPKKEWDIMVEYTKNLKSIKIYVGYYVERKKHNEHKRNKKSD